MIFLACVATARAFGFPRLLFRWRGSFWKLIVIQFGVYFIIYNSINLAYMFALNDEQRKAFDDVGRKCGRLSFNLVGPVMFCLGFFIQQVYTRFCQHFLEVPWPDALAFLISAYVRGHDKKSRMLRRTMVRYGVASIVLTLMSTSERMQLIFPNLDIVVVAGFLNDDEAALLENVKPSSRHMVVLGWCAALFRKAHVSGAIEDEFGYNDMINELDQIRFKCRRLILYDWVSVPLAYTHTVLLGLNTFFTAAAVAGIHRIEVEKLPKTIDFMQHAVGEEWMVRLLAEAITLLQFTICAGMLATSQSLIRPFGTNDGNIDVDQIVKRHLSIAYIIVDDLFAVIPTLCPDQHLYESATNQSMDDLAVCLAMDVEMYKYRRKTRASIFSLHRTSQDLAELRDIGIVFEVESGAFGRGKTWRWLRSLPLLNRLFPLPLQRSHTSLEMQANECNEEDTATEVNIDPNSSTNSIPLTMTTQTSVTMRTFTLADRSAIQRILSFRRLN